MRVVRWIRLRVARRGVWRLGAGATAGLGRRGVGGLVLGPVVSFRRRQVPQPGNVAERGRFGALRVDGGDVLLLLLLDLSLYH